MSKIKICGITNLDDALLCVDAGADAIGVNLVPESSRFVEREEALKLARALKGRVLTVAVVADMPLDEMKALQADFGCIQLHGSEPPEGLAPLLPHAYKALRICSAQDVALATNYPG